MSMRGWARCKKPSSSTTFFLDMGPWLPQDINWIYLYADVHDYRFVGVPMDTVDKRLSNESTERKNDITNLNKKLEYFETTHRNSRQNLEQILKGGGRA
jgi:hypothetical protein